MVQTDIHYEVTDTFSGEANYSWVKRGKIEAKPGEEYSDLATVRRVKKSIGWENVKCRKENHGDMVALYPAGSCAVCFISFHSHGSVG